MAAATLPAQSAKIPLDGTDMGALSLKVILEKLHFESIEANIIQEFPATTFTIEGMPLGFSGMEFPDVKLEIEMLNGIRLPVILDFDMIGVNQKNETLKVPQARLHVFRTTRLFDADPTQRPPVQELETPGMVIGQVGVFSEHQRSRAGLAGYRIMPRANGTEPCQRVLPPLPVPRP